MPRRRSSNSSNSNSNSNASTGGSAGGRRRDDRRARPLQGQHGPSEARGSTRCPDYIGKSKVVKKLRAGQAGTLKAGLEHGASLLCVRYRRDALNLYRIKTVELVVQARPVDPRRFDRASFGVALTRHETELRARLKAAGARWDPQDQLWWVPGRIIRAWGLEDRIRQI